MRPVFLAATIALLGCATGDGDSAPAPLSDAVASDTTAARDSIFAVEDSAPPLEEDTNTEPDIADSGELDTAPATTTLTIDTTECKVITCPSTHPYVVGCKVILGGASSQACAVHVAGSSTVNFKEGQSCGDIAVRGTITCAGTPGTGLNATNCTMNKPTSLYVSTLGACPG